MTNFFAELKRRQMFRVAAAYAVVSWLLLQIVNNVAPILDLPVWVARTFLLALAIGFPIALLFVWMRDLASPDTAAPRPATTKLDYVLAGGLILVIGLVSYQQLASTSPKPSARQSDSSQPAAGDIAIAVLPFANLSGDAAQEFFSDGMTEEITAALAKVPSLRVVGRTSAFQFKGQNPDFAAIRQALGVAYLIDGSVRKDGDRVRITAQLIEADSGLQLWSENYDRLLTDIFAIQEDIAQAIAMSLRVPLGLQQGGSLVRNRTQDLESYQDYLKARALFRGRRANEAKAILDLAVARDPGFAPSWALLSRNHASVPFYSAAMRAGTVEEARRTAQSSFDDAERAARRAIALDPEHAGGYSALGTLEHLRGHFGAAEDLFKQALMLDANDPDGLYYYCQALLNVGRVREALRLIEQLRSLEPFVPIYNIVTADIMRASGQAPASIPILEAVAPDPVLSLVRNTALGEAYAEAGHYREAADVLLAIRGPLVSRKAVEDAARLIRQAPARLTATQALPVLQGELNFVYAHVGALDRILDYPERNLEIGINSLISASHLLWVPEYAPLRKTERFKAYVRNAGLVAYWRARGWPDLCRPMGADDFVCD
jgi:TolB-like protein